MWFIILIIYHKPIELIMVTIFTLLHCINPSHRNNGVEVSGDRLKWKLDNVEAVFLCSQIKTFGLWGDWEVEPFHAAHCCPCPLPWTSGGSQGRKDIFLCFPLLCTVVCCLLHPGLSGGVRPEPVVKRDLEDIHPLISQAFFRVFWNSCSMNCRGFL